MQDQNPDFRVNVYGNDPTAVRDVSRDPFPTSTRPGFDPVGAAVLGWRGLNKLFDPRSTPATTSYADPANAPAAYVPTQIGLGNGGATLPYGNNQPLSWQPNTPPAPAYSGGSRMSDLIRYGLGPVIGGATSLIGNSANNRAAAAAAAQQERQFAITQAFLEAQEKARHDDYLLTEAEKKRQFDLTEEEKRRQYDLTDARREPFREAAKGNLVRMNSLLDQPRPARLDLSWMDRNT
jgi:hypothetical protein